MKNLACLLVVTLVLAIGFGAKNVNAAQFADIGFVIDQSGSMGGEFSWLGNSINEIDAAMGSAGISANYGVAGYEYYAGDASSSNAWVDMTSNISDIINEVNSVSVYGGTERGYHAAEWAANNFTWSGDGHAKIMILITDESNDYRSSYTYGGLNGEEALAKMTNDNGIFLNVITFQRYYTYWDGAVFSNSDTGYQGLFDLDFLRTNPSEFTSEFTSAKIAEIQSYPTDPNPVPEPATILLLGGGLAGLMRFRKRA